MTGINKIIMALIELESLGCHTVFFEYGNGFFHIRIFKGEVCTDNIVYEKSVNPVDEQAEVEKIFKHVNDMKYYVCKTSFLCHKREFVKNEKSGGWIKTKPLFEVGKNSTKAMLIDGSGYFIDDPDNGLQYFVNMNELSDM